MVAHGILVPPVQVRILVSQPSGGRLRPASFLVFRLRHGSYAILCVSQAHLLSGGERASQPVSENGKPAAVRPAALTPRFRSSDTRAATAAPTGLRRRRLLLPFSSRPLCPSPPAQTHFFHRYPMMTDFSADFLISGGGRIPMWTPAPCHFLNILIYSNMAKLSEGGPLSVFRPPPLSRPIYVKGNSFNT